MVRLQVLLDSTEASVLAQWAASELRDPRDQIRLLLHQELQRRGLLPTTIAVPTADESDMLQPDSAIHGSVIERGTLPR